MPKHSVEVTSLQQREIIRHLFNKPELTGADKVLMVQLDPDLSDVRRIAEQESAANHGASVRTHIDKMFDVAVEKLYTPLPEKPATPSPELTLVDAQALQNLVRFVTYQGDRLDRVSAQRVADQFLILFSYICRNRPDVARSNIFPWDKAVESALWAHDGGFVNRMVVLGKAPADVVKEQLSDHVLKGGDIIDVLVREELGFGRKQELMSPEFFTLVERLPNDQTLVRSLVRWIGRQEHSAIWREIEKAPMKIKSELLSRAEALVEAKWEALSPHDKATFLTPGLVFDLRELYPEKLEDPMSAKKEALEIFSAHGTHVLVTAPRLLNLIPRIILAASKETRAAISKDMVFRVTRNKQLKLGVIAEWFPEISEKVEYVRTVPLAKRLLNGIRL